VPLFVILDFLMVIFVYALSGLDLYKDLNQAYKKEGSSNDNLTTYSIMTGTNGWRYILVSDYAVLFVMVYKTLRGM